MMLRAACLLLALSTPLAAQTDLGTTVVSRASRAYQGLSSFQANFHQHFDDKFVDMVDGKGTLYQEGKNHFAMRFSEPANDAIVADGASLWVYTPSETPGTITKYRLQNFATYGTNFLGALLDNAVERYRITYVKSETIDNHVTDAVTLEPISPDMGFRRATVWFDRELYMPRRLEIEEPQRVRIVTLSNVQLNRSIPPSVFVCKPPAGTRVVTQ